MKIELLHPPDINCIEHRLDVPLGLLSIASALRESFSDLEIVVNDLSGIRQEDWNIGYADFYGITVYIVSIPVIKDIMKICKMKNPKSKIIIGGAHPSAVPYSKDFQMADYIVVGFGESIIKSIIFFNRYMTEKVFEGKFDKFYFPAYDLVDLNSYKRTVGDLKCVSMITSRGCPFTCVFCGLSHFHNLNGTHFMDVGDIEKQLFIIREKFGMKALNIQDDIFTLKKERLFEILNIMKRFKPLFKFRCLGRAGNDTEEMYEKMAEAGCVQIAWGIESGSQYLLDRMNKKATVQDNFNVIKWAKKYGITSRAFFIMGFPGETRETIEETKRFILEAEPDQYSVSNFIPYPGTDVAKNPEKYGIIQMSDDWNQYFQLDASEMGGLTIDTQWLSRQEFRELEIDFRTWLKKNVKFRGPMLSYEKKIRCIS